MSEARTLGIVRILVGAIFLIRSTPLIYLFPGLVANHGGPLLGWPSSPFRIGLFGIVLPLIVVKALVIVRGLAALFFMMGVRARWAGIVAALSAYLVYSQEPFAFIFTLHVLYASTLILACTDATAIHAIRPEPVRSPRSSVALVRAFVVSIYAWGAIAKLRPSWLSGRTLYLLYGDRILAGRLADLTLSSVPRARASAIAVIVLEAMLGPLLLMRRTRVIGLVLACGMHAAFEVTAHPDVFGWVMVALLLSFWSSYLAMPPEVQ